MMIMRELTLEEMRMVTGGLARQDMFDDRILRDMERKGQYGFDAKTPSGGGGGGDGKAPSGGGSSGGDKNAGPIEHVLDLFTQGKPAEAIGTAIGNWPAMAGQAVDAMTREPANGA